MGYQMGSIQGYTEESLICKEKINMLNRSISAKAVSNDNILQNNYKESSPK